MLYNTQTVILNDSKILKYVYSAWYQVIIILWLINLEMMSITVDIYDI